MNLNFAPAWEYAPSDVQGNIGCPFDSNSSFQPTVIPDSYNLSGLPPGLTYDSTTGEVTGTPTTTGDYTVTATVTAGGVTGIPATYTITILPPPSVTLVPETIYGIVGEAVSAPQYSPTISGVGSDTISPTYTYSLSNPSGLPAGLALDNTYLISGTPTVAGTVVETVSATFPFSPPLTASAAVSVVVYPNGPGIELPPPPFAMVGQPFSYQPSPVDGSNGATYSSTTLPSGLALNSATGVISGTPTSATPTNAPAQITITATDSNSHSSTATLSLAILPAAIQATAGTPLTFSVASGNGASGFEIVNGPTGLQIDATTGTISWTPLAAGIYSVNFSMQDSAGYQSETIQIDVAPNATDSILNLQEGVSPAANYLVPAAGISSATPSEPLAPANVLSVGQASTNPAQPDVRRMLLSFDLSAVPAGATITSASLVLTPQATGSAGSSFDVQVFEALSDFDSSSADWSTDNVAQLIELADLNLDPANLPAAATFVDTSSFTSAVQNDLVSGKINLIVLSSQAEVQSPADLINFTAHGTPGAANPELVVTYTMGSGPPVITSAQVVTGTVGTPLSYSITANPKATSFSAAPTPLPAWMTFSTTTGAITGTPGSVGSTPITVTATNSSGSASQQVLFNVDGAVPATTLTITGGNNQTAPVGTFAATQLQVQANHGPCLVTFSCPPGDGMVAAAANSNAAASSLIVPTDAGGNASCYLLMPQSVKPVTVTATAGIAPAVTFNATAVTGLLGTPTSQSDVPVLSILGGAAQAGPSGSVLAEPIVIQAVDHLGQPWSSLPISFAVVHNAAPGAADALIASSSSGTFGSQFAVSTDASGRATFYLKPGTGPSNLVSCLATPTGGLSESIYITAATSSGTTSAPTPGGAFVPPTPDGNLGIPVTSNNPPPPPPPDNTELELLEFGPDGQWDQIGPDRNPFNTGGIGAGCNYSAWVEFTYPGEPTRPISEAFLEVAHDVPSSNPNGGFDWYVDKQVKLAGFGTVRFQFDGSSTKDVNYTNFGAFSGGGSSANTLPQSGGTLTAIWPGFITNAAATVRWDGAAAQQFTIAGPDNTSVSNGGSISNTTGAPATILPIVPNPADPPQAGQQVTFHISFRDSKGNDAGDSSITFTVAPNKGKSTDYSESLDEASGPKYRKIALNGLPLSDDKPQQASESDQEDEQTYIDALTMNLRHSTTDVYMTIPGSDLTVSARRDTSPEVWNDTTGLHPHERWDEPFGIGWTSNLAANIRIENAVNAKDPTPIKAYVTDEAGAVHSFYYSGNGTFFPMPTARSEQTPNLETLTAVGSSANSQGVATQYVFKRKYGMTLTYQSIGGFGITPANRATGQGGGLYSILYARLVQAQDRLGNTVLYHFSGAKNLVPDKITVVNHPDLTLSIAQDSNGHITSIWDASHNVTTYVYAQVMAPSGTPEWTLTSVTAPGQAPSTTQYSYSFASEADPTTTPPGNYTTKYFFGDLASITDPLNHTYTFTYALDSSKLSYMANSSYYTGYYVQQGVPRDVIQVGLPDGSTTKLQNQSLTYLIPDTGAAAGKRQVQVTDASGFVRLYRFGDSEVFPLSAMINSGNVSQTNIITYNSLSIDNGSSADGSYVGTETFVFDPTASMAVASVTDLSGNTTTYHHTDPWTNSDYATGLAPSASGDPAAYNNFYDDPTAEIDAKGFEKDFTYTPGDRIMQTATDADGNKTVYAVDSLGRRTKESIFLKNATTPTQVTDFVYGDSRFPGFMTEKTIEQQGSGDPAWVSGESLTTQYVADDNGRVAQEIVDPNNQALTTSYTYDANGNKLSSTDPKGYTTWFSYDARNRLVAVTNPDGSRKYTCYDGASNKVADYDENGNATLYAYDFLNRLTTQARDLNGNGAIDARPVDLVTSYTYNAANSKLTTTNPRGETMVSAYDSIQRLTSVTDAKGNATRFVYGTNSGGSVFSSSDFKPTETIDPRVPYKTDISYDELYRPLSKSVHYDQAGDISTTSTSYDPNGNALTTTDPRGHVTTMVYDALNRPTRVTYADTTFATTGYTSTGLKYQATDENGHQTQYQYDTAGRLTDTIQPSVYDAASNSTKAPDTHTIYDANGNVAATINPLTNEWDYAYDSRNRKIQELAPAAANGPGGTMTRAVTQWNYDPAGRVTATLDAKGAETDTTYDRANRVIEVDQPAVPVNGGSPARPVTHTSYDADGNVASVTDANNHTTINSYDELDRLSTTTDAANITVKNGYDAVGNKTSVTDGRNHTTRFAYDGLNRNTQVTDPLAQSTTFSYDGLLKTSRLDANGQTTSYTYDQRNRLSGVSYSPTSANNFARTYGYDNAGNLQSVTESGLSAANVAYTYDALNRVHTETSNGISHEYDYDQAGNRLVTKYDTANGSTELTLTSAYDADNRLSTLAESSRTSTYAYDLNGNIVQKVSPNGDVETTTFDAVNRMTSQGTINGSNTLYNFAYGYDLVGNLTVDQETYPSGLNNRTVTNAYDNINRLASEAVTGSAPNTTTNYTYDAANNRSEMDVTGGSSPGSTTYAYNDVNQLTSFTNGAGTTSYTYDNNGNRSTRTQGGATDTYSYDDENRLVALTKNTSGGAGTYSYQYDYRTRRISRTESGVTTAIVFSGGTSVREYTGTPSGAPIVQFLRGSDYGGGVGGILYSVRSGTPSYTHENRRGDVVAKTSAAGALTYQAQYAAFGNQTQTNGSTLDRQKSNSKDTDPTGLVNEGARPRDLETGGFITKDPAGFVDGPNEYTYVVDNPWTHFDPDGLTTEDRIEGYAQGVTNGLIGTANAIKDAVIPGGILLPNIPQVNNEHLATDKGDFEAGSRGGTVFFAGGSATIGGVGGVEAAGARATEEVARGGAKAIEEATISSPKPEPSSPPGGQSASSTSNQSATDAATQAPKGSNNSNTAAAANRGSSLHSDKPGNLPDQLRNKYPDTRFKITKPGEKGQDVQVTGGTHPSDYPDSKWTPGKDYGDFKPDTVGGRKAFNQDQKNKWSQPTQMIPYNSKTGELSD